jgi:serine/threonine-protein kinase RIO1
MYAVHIRMQTYADVCWRMLYVYTGVACDWPADVCCTYTYADVCRRMLTYAVYIPASRATDQQEELSLTITCTSERAYVSIRQHTSAYVSIRIAYVSIRQHTRRRSRSNARLREHTSEYFEGSMKALWRLYEGSIKALSRFYQGSIKVPEDLLRYLRVLLRLYQGSIKVPEALLRFLRVLLRLYQGSIKVRRLY